MSLAAAVCASRAVVTMIEGNKDEAAKCVALAKKALLTGDFAKAQRLLGKAQRMFPSAECEALAAACAQKLNAADAAAGSPNPSQQERQGAAESNTKGHNKAYHQGPRQRRAPAAGSPPEPRFTRPHSSSAPGAAAATAAAAHTPEQARMCEVVLRETCYYKTLGVSRDASEEVIRKAYRRLALVLHPDKNKAPKAEDAFKKVSRIASTLLDPQERRSYDIGGSEAVEGRPHANAQRSNARQPDIVTAEDLFRVLFGHSLRDTGRSARASRSQQQYQEHSFHSLVQFLPMLLLLLMMFLFNMMPQEGTQPPVYYSFRQTREFPVPRTTQVHSVRYFVGEGFMQEILPQPEKVRELERKVEVRHYQGVCTSENDRLNRDLTTAHYHMASNESIKRLLDRPRPGCKKLELLQRSAGNVSADSHGP